jgi:predicted nuclease of predicted toxin-antitoxin system
VKIKFLADASLNRAIVTGVMRAERSIDFLTASAAQLAGVPDEEVLAIASRAGRVLVTHDIKTMPFYFAQYLAIACSWAGRAATACSVS